MSQHNKQLTEFVNLVKKKWESDLVKQAVKKGHLTESLGIARRIHSGVLKMQRMLNRLYRPQSSDSNIKGEQKNT